MMSVPSSETSWLGAEVIQVEFKASRAVILPFTFLFNIEEIKAFECLLLFAQMGAKLVEKYLKTKLLC